jgi:hypothetical protein
MHVACCQLTGVTPQWCFLVIARLNGEITALVASFCLNSLGIG